MFAALNTSVLNVESVLVPTEGRQNNTDEVILERNHLNVLFVVNDLHDQVTLLGTAEFTLDRNHTNVLSVTRRLVCLEI